MPAIAPSLLFYLKHAEEMDRLYEPEEPDVTDLPNPDETLRKIRQIGDAACLEAAKLLEHCGREAKPHLEQVGRVERVLNSVANTWEYKFRVWPKQGRQSKRSPVHIGICLDQRALIPWVYCRGSLRSEDQVKQALGFGLSSAELPDWWVGTVILEQVRIAIPERITDQVEAKPWIEKVAKVLKKITPPRLEKLSAIANGSQ